MSAPNPPIELSKINVLSPEADHREAAADNDAKWATYADSLLVAITSHGSWFGSSLLIIVPISPLFHEGAQNLRATPPLRSTYISF